MYCNVCYNEVRKEDTICYFCGNILIWNDNITPTIYDNEKKEEKTKVKQKTKSPKLGSFHINTSDN